MRILENALELAIDLFVIFGLFMTVASVNKTEPVNDALRQERQPYCTTYSCILPMSFAKTSDMSCEPEDPN